MRSVVSAIAGGLFGTGLMLSGMTDTVKVQGFLDVLGDWDPTLAFVMGGAIIPMVIAWRIAAARRSPALGGTFPNPPSDKLSRGLATGSVLFGMGWGLAGLCPGPALASLSYGGLGGLVFVAAMAAGIFAAPPVARRLEPAV